MLSAWAQATPTQSCKESPDQLQGGEGHAQCGQNIQEIKWGSVAPNLILLNTNLLNADHTEFKSYYTGGQYH